MLEEREKQETVRLLYEYATDQAQSGADQAQIVAALVARGLEEGAARVIAQNALDVLGRLPHNRPATASDTAPTNPTAQAERAGANRAIFQGLALLGLGLVVWGFSFMVSRGAGISLLVYPPLIGGAFLVGWGVLRLERAKRIQEE